MKKGTTLVISSGEAQRENEVLLRKLGVDGWASSQGWEGKKHSQGIKAKEIILQDIMGRIGQYNSF